MGAESYLEELWGVVKRYRGLVRPREVGLPRPVPLVTPDEEALGAVRELGLKACMVEYHQLPPLKGDPHAELGFDGQILLSAVMPDEMLEDPSTFRGFVEAARRGFDAVVGWDAPVEVDIPEEESWRILVACLELTARLALELDAPVVPLSKGASEE
ncbi:hypothetical protein DRO33_02555 [Candidatus Bathyarchaeota archaeon]|nr:MAG: hypothetical protein DRO33_02555 [Candidatus Bathyarchaeota archaeon]